MVENAYTEMPQLVPVSQREALGTTKEQNGKLRNSCLFPSEKTLRKLLKPPASVFYPVSRI